MCLLCLHTVTSLANTHWNWEAHAFMACISVAVIEFALSNHNREKARCENFSSNILHALKISVSYFVSHFFEFQHKRVSPSWVNWNEKAATDSRFKWCVHFTAGYWLFIFMSMLKYLPSWKGCYCEFLKFTVWNWCVSFTHQSIDIVFIILTVFCLSIALYVRDNGCANHKK